MASHFDNVFLTVGTTEFDELLKSIDNEMFVKSLNLLSCKIFTLQMGRGVYIPSILPTELKKIGIEYELYRFKPTLDFDMKTANLIISHCGAGSILEALSLEKSLIVVVNDTLQGNHQIELAVELSKQNYCISTSPALLCDQLSKFQSSGGKLTPFPKPDYNAFPALIDNLMK